MFLWIVVHLKELQHAFHAFIFNMGSPFPSRYKLVAN
jgi:hypothetical protein